MSVRPLEIDDRRAVLDQLRGRIDALQGGPSRLSVPVPSVLEGLARLRTGGVYAVDSASLAMVLASGASAAGDWVGFVGWDDFGVEAAAQLGIALGRTVLVPTPGEHWLEVVAALVDVLRIVVLRPAGRIDPRSASVVQARLRSRDAVLLVHGERGTQGAWPQADATFSATEVAWDGVGRGSGRLHGQRARVVVREVGRPNSREIVLPYAAR
ncbi:hypothetical protein FXB39_20715 [Nocardioides sp. BGMRC 2183]|nr:hypothetical protein FXB39_20715 [Nocardioides sp. BGMRC 2183]